MLREPSADRAGLFGSEVEGEVVLLLVEKSELRTLVGVDDCEDACDRLAEIMAVMEKIHISSDLYFSSAIFRKTHILVSLDAAPPEIFCTRSWPNSVLSSSNCFTRSSLPLPQSWPVFTLVVDYFASLARRPLNNTTITYHRGRICCLSCQCRLELGGRRHN